MYSSTRCSNEKNYNTGILEANTETTVDCGLKTQLDFQLASDDIKTSSESKMTETNDPIERDSRGHNKVSGSTSQDRKGRPSSKQEEDISHLLSHVVGRACEGSVASDVSGLTDGEYFKTDDSYAPSASTPSKNKTYRTVRAPEPPRVFPGASKLTDIQSETTATTSSTRSNGDKLGQNKKKRSVSFCEVQVRNYERILEVNPSVTSGPAVGIGWNYSPDDDEIFSLENFEEIREFARCNSTDQLALPRDKREHLLRTWGYTQREIACSVRSILRSKNQRKQTIQNLHSSSMEEFVENATRKMKHALLLPLHKRKKAKQLFVYPSHLDSPTKNLESPVLKKTCLIHPSAA